MVSALIKSCMSLTLLFPQCHVPYPSVPSVPCPLPFPDDGAYWSSEPKLITVLKKTPEASLGFSIMTRLVRMCVWVGGGYVCGGVMCVWGLCVCVGGGMYVGGYVYV